jgi:acetoin utilization deacetylase AcuC-like enzyme
MRRSRAGSPSLRLPTLVVMEGGYAVDALGANVAAFLSGF